MLATTRTLTAGELRQVINNVPDHMPVVVHAHITCDVDGVDCDRGYASYSGELSVEDIRQAINCIELHACD